MLHVVVEYWLLTEAWQISQGLAYMYEYPEKNYSLIPDQKQWKESASTKNYHHFKAVETRKRS